MFACAPSESGGPDSGAAARDSWRRGRGRNVGGRCVGRCGGTGWGRRRGRIGWRGRGGRGRHWGCCRFVWRRRGKWWRRAALLLAGAAAVAVAPGACPAQAVVAVARAASRAQRAEVAHREVVGAAAVAAVLAAPDEEAQADRAARARCVSTSRRNTRASFPLPGLLGTANVRQPRQHGARLHLRDPRSGTRAAGAGDADERRAEVVRRTLHEPRLHHPVPRRQPRRLPERPLRHAALTLL